MIPTVSKSVLPKTLSWPLGAQQISEGLADAPHVSEFSLSFCRRPVWPESEFQKLLRDSQPYTILVARYKPTASPGYCGASFMVERGWYEVKWEVEVYPVLRSLRAVSAGVLRQQGLPDVEKWLHSFSQVGWESRYQSITLTFAPADGTLITNIAEGN